LAKSIDLDELKSIRDKAEALRNYAGLASDMARRCQELRLRAERRIGELLAKAVQAGNPQLSYRSTIGLGKLGISHRLQFDPDANGSSTTANRSCGGCRDRTRLAQ